MFISTIHNVLQRRSGNIQPEHRKEKPTPRGKSRLDTLVLVFCLLIASTSVTYANERESDTLLWIGSVSVNYKKLEFQQLNTQNNNKFEAKPNFFTLNLSLTAAYNAFYISGNYDLPLQEYEENSKKYDVASNRETYRYARTDANITVGYSLFKSVALFGGYLLGETEIDYEVIDHLGTTSLKGTDFLTENGGFFGLHYSIPITHFGAFSLNIAYALLAGEYEFNVNESPSGTQSGVIAGNTDGLSYGVKYTNTIFNSTYFYIAFKANKYSFESDGGSFNTVENFSIFTIGLSTVF